MAEHGADVRAMTHVPWLIAALSTAFAAAAFAVAIWAVTSTRDLDRRVDDQDMVISSTHVIVTDMLGLQRRQNTTIKNVVNNQKSLLSLFMEPATRGALTAAPAR